jgi:hypothetical protein
MELLALIVPILIVFVAVVGVALIGSWRPQLALYAIVSLPLLVLALLIWFFTQPTFVESLSLSPDALPQVLASSVGAVLGIIGAGMISLMEKKWTEEQQKKDLDWRLRATLKDCLSTYPYDPSKCGAKELMDIKEILKHAYHEADGAINKDIIPKVSVYMDYIQSMQSHYPSIA